MEARATTMDLARRLSIGLAGVLAVDSLAGPAHAQCVTLHQTLVPSDASAYHAFGSVAIDAAGSVLAVGAPGNPSAAYVYERSGPDWIQVAKLISSEPQIHERFGDCVALSGDGQTLIVGARSHSEGSALNCGAAYVFVRTATGWELQTQLMASEFAYDDSFGVDIALSDDGNTALVSAPYKTELNVDDGVVYVFVRSGATWSEQSKLLMPGAVYTAYFGESVALSAGGDVALIGAPDDDALGGSAHVFRRDGASWGPSTQLTHRMVLWSDAFGSAVALSADGSTAFVGSPGQASGPSAGGAAYVFGFDGASWSQLTSLSQPSSQGSDRFGDGIAIAADGSTAWIAAPLRDGASFNDGVVYVFDRVGTNWPLRATLQQNDAQEEDRFGQLAVDADGSSVVIGVPSHDTAFLESGIAYTYEDAAPTLTHYCTAKTNSQGCVPALTTTGTPSWSAGTGFTLAASNVLNNKSGLFFYSTTASQGVPFQGGWLCAKPPIKRTATINSGGNPPPNDCSGALAIDFNAHITSGVDPALTIEATVWGQFWSRDPGFAPPNNTSLTGAIRFGICH